LIRCKTPETLLSIPEREMPGQYAGSQGDTLSLARLNWKDYFSDTTLQQLIDSALTNNQDLQIAWQRIEVSSAQVRAAGAALMPSVFAQANLSMRKFGYYTMDDAGNRVTEYAKGDTIPTHLPDYFIGLTSTWELDVWGRLRTLRQSALSNYLAGREGRNFVVSNLVSEIATAYYTLLAFDNELAIILQTIGKQQESLEVVKIQKEAGRANELAVKQFEAQLTQSKIFEQEIRQKITETENRINLLIGRYPQPIARQRDNLYTGLPAMYSAGVPSQLLAYRPDVRESSYRLMATRFELGSARASFLPSFNITAQLGYQALAARFLFSTPRSIMYNVLGGMVAPVINRRAIQAQFSSAKANQLSAMYAYQKTILNGYVEVVNELSGIDRLQEISALKKKQNELLLRSVEAATELYRTAKASYLEVLIVQQQSLQTQLEMVEVGRRQKIASISLYKALGGGW
jgi:multidrug efflux system outer membrane protein